MLPNFRWEKRGLLFSPEGRYGWMHDHAQCPYAVVDGDRVRVYFATRSRRDAHGMPVARSGYVELLRENLAQVLAVSEQPLVPLGGAGEFDEFGNMAGSVVVHGGQHYLYYCGWQRMTSVPYNWAIGLALSEDGRNFRRYGKGPLLAGTPREPYLQACPIVQLIDGTWHMWYLSGLDWLDIGGKKESVYKLMHATSSDGIDWRRDGQPVLPDKVEHECQTSCSIIEMNGLYHMWFSYRHGLDFRNAERGYRIGYAWSTDLRNWHRDDVRAGIDVSDSGWDSQMVCYPHVCRIDGRLYLFYCGNEFGRGGFGYAELVAD